MDKRRFGVIEVRQINAETYWLEIGAAMWSEVEWSRARQMWCVQDAAGHCLTHVEHIVGQDRDPQTAIRLAKRMIVDGRMPTPEEAHNQLRVEQDRVRLGEPTIGENVTETKTLVTETETQEMDETELVEGFIKPDCPKCRAPASLTKDPAASPASPV